MLVDIGPYRGYKKWWKPLTWFKRRVNVKIEPWDCVNLDHTLALIILPALKDLRDAKPGAPHVDNVDVPEALRSTPEEDEVHSKAGDVDDNWHPRWEYVLNEMIWAFEQVADPDESWEDKFIFLDEREPDWDGYRAYSNRINQGLILFGKYFRALWT